jgi:predicted transposase YbfD/YdcC
MNYTIPHTFKLQDGSLCNFKKRIWKRATPLIAFFAKINDPRKKRGIRHSHVLILFILFAAIIRGETTIKQCYVWACHNKKFLRRYFPLTHGIPVETTISRLIQEMGPLELIEAFMEFLKLLGIDTGKIGSIDGKTLRAVGKEDAVRHILSLFTHLTHTVLYQEGVDSKENEIPALRRMLPRIPFRILRGFLFLADALHAQVETAQTIVDLLADYLLVVKGNQKDFFEDIYFSFTPQEDMPGTNWQSQTSITSCCTYGEKTRKRDVVTTVMVSNNPSLCTYLIKEHRFASLKTVGMLHRVGKRIHKDGSITPVDEIVCFVSSRKLSAREAAGLLRAHWCIENLLHWVKDFVYLEDRHTLRIGNAPQIMTFLRSMAISLGNLAKIASLSTAIQNMSNSKGLHYQYLRMVSVV